MTIPLGRYKNSPAIQGSWLNLSWYIQNSVSLHEFWNSRSPEDRDLISSLWGENCWEKPLDVWEKDPNSLFRILTLLHHWESVKNKV